MFELLSEKLQSVFRQLTGKGRLTEQDVDAALRQVRVALLEADVHFRVARDFIAKVRERALGSEVLQSLTPGQQVIQIVHQELVAVLGGAQSHLELATTPPTTIMLAGLQGSGKTTAAAKLALHLRGSGQRPLLVAADIHRPAAVAQLETLAKQSDLPVYSEGNTTPAPTICAHALRRARELGSTVIVVDTAGRLHIDTAMMEELAQVKAALSPSEVLLVVDAMAGQDAVRAAEEFHGQIGLTGLILTKMDGDARGGAALSIRSVTGLPVKFIGTGERIEALEPYHPDRLASRILGMGDILSLIERAQASVTEERAQELERKLRRASFDLEDFLEQLREMRKMGPLSQLLEMIPGLSRMTRQLPPEALAETRAKRVEAIILSMTPQERRHPDSIDGSRRRRIARGSGTTPQDINQLLNQFRQMRKLLQQYGGSRGGRGRPRGPFPFDLFQM